MVWVQSAIEVVKCTRLEAAAWQRLPCYYDAAKPYVLYWSLTSGTSSTGARPAQLF